MVIEKIELKNFGSFEEEIFEFKGINAVCGKNLTDKGQESNGSGKSFLIESIFYGICGFSQRKVKDSELIMWGEKNATIKLHILKTNNSKILIHRTINRKGSNKVSVFVDDVEEKELTSVNESNKFILDILGGYSREEIQNYFIISKEKYISFFSSSDTSKKNLISNFSKSDSLDFVIEKENSIVSEKEVEHLKNVSKLDNQESDFDEILLNEKNSFDRNKKSKIESKENILSLSKETLLFEEKRLEARSNSLLESNKLLVETTNEKLTSNKDLLADLDLLKSELKLENSKLAKHKSDIKETESIKSNIEKKLLGSIECPKCSHTFNSDNEDVNLDEEFELVELANSTLSELEESRKKVSDECARLKSCISEKEVEVSVNEKKKKNKERRIDAISLEINETEQIISKSKNSISVCKEDIEKIQNDIEAINKTDFDKKEFEKSEIQYKEKLELLKIQVAESNKKLEFHKTWLAYFKSFKNFLNKNALDVISSESNRILSIISDFQIEMLGFKELANGKISDKIDVSIFRNDEKISFGSLSGGEKARIELCVTIAISNIMNESKDDGFEFLIIDEVLESLDSLGIKDVLKSISILDIDLLLVTQNSLDIDDNDSFRKIIVKKESGVSNIEI